MKIYITEIYCDICLYLMITDVVYLERRREEETGKQYRQSYTENECERIKEVIRNDLKEVLT